MEEILVVILVIVAIIYAVVVVVMPFKIWNIAQNITVIIDILNRRDNKNDNNLPLYDEIVRLEMLNSHEEAIQTLYGRMNDKLSYLIKQGQAYGRGSSILQRDWDDTIKGCENCFSYLNENMPDYYRNFDFSTFSDNVEKLKNAL